MTRQLFIFCLTLLALNSRGQKFVDKINKDSLSKTIVELNVILIDNLKTTKLPPDCGVFQPQNMTFKYEVIKVISGDYKAKTILINHRCPREMVDKKLIENKKSFTYKLRPLQNQVDAKTNIDKVEFEVVQ